MRYRRAADLQLICTDLKISSVKQENEVNNYSIIRQEERCVKLGRISTSLVIGNERFGVQNSFVPFLTELCVELRVLFELYALIQVL